MQCRNCKSPLTPFLSLGKMPLVNSFLKRKADFRREKRFNLAVGFCPRCFLVQLINIVPPEDLFRDYLYFSSTSSSFLKHCEENSVHLTKKLGLTSQSLVLEVASNDGAQLRCFQKLGIQILGVDPAKNIAKVANKKGIKTIPEFFNYDFAKKLEVKIKRKADLIFGSNVLAHVPGIRDFLAGVKTILAPGGSAVFEFPYLEGLMKGKFDTIYHEHVFYYSLIAIRNLFYDAGLELYDVEMTTPQGGSLMVYVSQPNVFSVTNRVTTLANKELRSGFNKIATYFKISDTILRLKNDITATMNQIVKSGKTIAAYGASAKGNILLNYFGVSDRLSFIADKAEAKQGLYTPGTHLLVHSPAKIFETKPDYVMILCWNIADEVIVQLNDHRDRGGKFIIPVPRLKLV